MTHKERMIDLIQYLLSSIMRMKCAIKYHAHDRVFTIEPSRTETIVLTEEEIGLVKELVKHKDPIYGPLVEELIRQCDIIYQDEI